MNNITSNLIKFLAGALMIFGLSGNTVLAANNCLSDENAFSSSIGSTTSCADHKGTDGLPMKGCVVGAGGTECNYSGDCNFHVSVPGGVGTGDSTSYTVTGDCQARMAITQGNQGANYCAYFYPAGVGSQGDTLTTTGKNDRAVSHKQLEVCTDGDKVTASPPVISLEMKVVRVVDNSFDCADATEEINGIAPMDVVYCYTIRNDGQSGIDSWTITNDRGTPDDDNDNLPPLTDDGSGLAGGSSVSAESGIVPITDAGVLVSTAEVTSTFSGICTTCGDTDTATVNVVVECDASTQEEANITGTVVERRGLKGTTRCAPKTTTVDLGVGLLCDGTCELKPECVADQDGDAAPPASCVQPCKKSGNWTTWDQDTPGGSPVCFSHDLATSSPGKLPLCQEVLTNPENLQGCGDTDGDGILDITTPAFVRSDGHGIGFRRNPYLYYFPASGGGNSIGTIYCILYPGESTSDCPSGSIVY